MTKKTPDTNNVSSMVSDNLRSKLKGAGQEHLLHFIDAGKTNHTETTQLINQLEKLELNHIISAFKSATHPPPTHNNSEILTPLECYANKHSISSTDLELWNSTGIKALSHNEVAVVVLSGGQGTRLGFDAPKGMYNIKLPSNKTLFQLHAERIVRLKQLSNNSKIPWYIMTSPLNDSTIRTYFANNNYFGLPPEDIFFFVQGTLPCMTPEGKIILETKHQIATAPDGNGGIYPALQKSGALQDMEERGVKYIHVYAIDNAIVKIADPVFMGYCITNEADCGNKVVWKVSPDEKVGVLVQRGGKPQVVEYSEMDAECCSRVDKDGKLVFGAGNICNHFYRLDFIRDTILTKMKGLYHIAHKKIPHVSIDGNSTIKPESPNGIKMESFIFDAFSLSKNMAVLEVEREGEFAPVKNAPGTATDNPDTARAMISREAIRWAAVDGGAILYNKYNNSSTKDLTCEISPLKSINGEGLKYLSNTKLGYPFHIK